MQMLLQLEVVVAQAGEEVALHLLKVVLVAVVDEAALAIREVLAAILVVLPIPQPPIAFLQRPAALIQLPWQAEVK
jgi:hypothetical protein